MQTITSIKRNALIIALAGVYPLLAQANAGTAQFSVGEVSLQRATSSAPLSSGGRVESGDLITTGSTGRTQLRFTDGGMVSLQPNSQFKISKYADAGDGKQDSFLVDLARGGMRALTGLIGKRNRDNYKVTTTTATIGIRGSGFSMAYNPDGSLGVTTEQDAIEVCTKAGCVGLNLGESALVTNAETLPTRTRERANWNPPEPRRLITARNDDTNITAKPLTAPAPSTVVQTGLAFAGAGLPTFAANPVVDERFYLNGTAIFSVGDDDDDGGGALAGYQEPSGNQLSGGTATVLSSSGSYAAGDLLVLGTWQNSVWSNGAQETPLATSAFVMGQVTPVPTAGMASLFPSAATYNMSSATQVFSSNGGEGTLNSGTINVSNMSTAPTVNVNLQANFSAVNYFLNGSSALDNSGTFTVPLAVTSTTCTANCGTGNANGFFVGSTAQSAGLSFSATTIDDGKIGGAATFNRVPQSP